jgi:KDO2-lipid IV(A) lauroyltransferase
MTREAKRVKRILRRPFEWMGILLALAVIVPLPRKMMLKICDFISFVMYRFDAKGRARVNSNLEIMFPLLSEKRKTVIAKRSYRNMARTVGHAIWTMCFARRRVAASGEVDAACAKILKSNPSLVTVSGHIGCWEILSQLAFLHGHRMMSVAKNIGTKSMTSLLMKSRRSIGQEIVPAEGAFKPLYSGVRSGKSLGLLVDQVVDTKDGGIYVEFFGRPHAVSSAPAFFSARAKVPIIVAWSRPLKDGRYRCEYLDFITSEETRDIWYGTNRCIKNLERVIRRHPSCWVLNYNCFKSTPSQSELEKLQKEISSHG